MSNLNQATVRTEPLSGGPVHASFAHHRGFPETRSEGPPPRFSASPSITEDPAISRPEITALMSLSHTPRNPES